MDERGELLIFLFEVLQLDIVGLLLCGHESRIRNTVVRTQ